MRKAKKKVGLIVAVIAGIIVAVCLILLIVLTVTEYRPAD